MIKYCTAALLSGMFSFFSLYASVISPITKDGVDGEYYGLDGRYLGSDSIADDKVYVVARVDTSQMGKARFPYAVDLRVTHSQFAVAANIIRYESLDGDKTEVLYIAHAANNRAKELGGNIHSLLMTGYSSVPGSLKREMKKTDTLAASNHTRAGLIDVLLGNPDPTNGATFWDGTDFLAWGLKSPNGTPQNKFEEYKSVEIHLDIFYKYLFNHQLRYPTEIVKYRRKAYNFPADVFKTDENWSGPVFKYITGSTEPFGIVATAAAGMSIFWKTVK